MLIFGLTIFTGAFLLFLIQPLIAKFILPWFGGSPDVWTTCMLFFQAQLLGGYAYAHFSTRHLTPRRQVLVHMLLLATALLLFPITPSSYWKPPDGLIPVVRILLLLTACIGLPYLVLSATGPLMQAWFSKAQPGRSPYRLYALSNIGSLLALVSYPFFIEPNFSRLAQAKGWSLGLAGFALLALGCGILVWLSARNKPAPLLETGIENTVETAPAVPAPDGNIRSMWLCFALPACACVLLLAVTNKICQDLSVIPFLWVLPLSLYLLSFIVCFDSPRWYWRPFWLPILVVSICASLWVMVGSSLSVPDYTVLYPIRWLLEIAGRLSMFKIIGIYLGTLFVCCMVCHGEVYRLRPSAQKLTGYYLLIAAGGAFGGLFVAVLAPLIFKGYFELHVGLLTAALLVIAVLYIDQESPLHGGRHIWAWALVLLALIGLGAGFYHDVTESLTDTVEIARTFYGVLKVNEYYANDPEMHQFTLEHGSTTHGLQFVSPSKRRMPTSYYTSRSGIGRTMEYFPQHANRRIGLVGLGTGSFVAWVRAGDYVRIYEINNQVQRLAHNRFHYLEDTEAKTEVVLGDARLSLEREPDQQFDIIILDAFSSDSVPIHLLTREAFELYRRHLRSDGIIAVHISNRYLDLEPIVIRVAEYFVLKMAIIHHDDLYNDDEDADASGTYRSDWVLLTRNAQFVNQREIAEITSDPKTFSNKIRMWTDEQSNLLQILDADKDSWLEWLRNLAL